MPPGEWPNYQEVVVEEGRSDRAVGVVVYAA
ncbi:uncharacterized protein FRV6_16439 [Fusarium oxysporum]|uniref:Uncharacterized protein n=1 Tax=Fusarium oxysporum TaxID=5507 RepID=A0A2H3U2V1_FUSOX|nr:uncharacterized protein FRV6_16439 [Fusarium oxysporum]